MLKPAPNNFHLTAAQKARLSAAVEHFPDYRILVVGDLMLDVFIWGEVQRISPEAPVPVVEVREETRLLGGTANVVNNVAALGGAVLVSGVVGDDAPGRELARLFEVGGIASDGLVVEPGRPTTIKTRIIAQNQQVVRFDRESKGALQTESVRRIISHIKSNLAGIDATIISDYAKGMITREFMDEIRAMHAPLGIPVIVDPKVQHTDLYSRATMVTPNHHEASRMSGIEIRDEASLIAAGKLLLERLQCQTVLITRGKDGMCLLQQNGSVTQIPTLARRVYDVTGAGDTVIATLTLGIVAGLPVEESALLANLAAGIVVGEVGTATVPSDRLLAAIEKS
jgi:rfaE bifunctional protein kinase chain/domain